MVLQSVLCVTFSYDLSAIGVGTTKGYRLFWMSTSDVSNVEASSVLPRSHGASSSTRPPLERMPRIFVPDPVGCIAVLGRTDLIVLVGGRSPLPSILLSPTRLLVWDHTSGTATACKDFELLPDMSPVGPITAVSVTPRFVAVSIARQAVDSEDDALGVLPSSSPPSAQTVDATTCTTNPALPTASRSCPGVVYVYPLNLADPPLFVLPCAPSLTAHSLATCPSLPGSSFPALFGFPLGAAAGCPSGLVSRSEHRLPAGTIGVLRHDPSERATDGALCRTVAKRARALGDSPSSPASGEARGALSVLVGGADDDGSDCVDEFDYSTDLGERWVTVEAHSGPIGLLKFGRPSRGRDPVLASTSIGGTVVHLWRVGSCGPIEPIGALRRGLSRRVPWSLSFHASLPYVAMVGASGTLHIWTLEGISEQESSKAAGPTNDDDDDEGTSTAPNRQSRFKTLANTASGLLAWAMPTVSSASKSARLLNPITYLSSAWSAAWYSLPTSSTLAARMLEQSADPSASASVSSLQTRRERGDPPSRTAAQISSSTIRNERQPSFAADSRAGEAESVSDATFGEFEDVKFGDGAGAPHWSITFLGSPDPRGLLGSDGRLQLFALSTQGEYCQLETRRDVGGECTVTDYGVLFHLSTPPPAESLPCVTAEYKIPGYTDVPDSMAWSMLASVAPASLPM